MANPDVFSQWIESSPLLEPQFDLETTFAQVGQILAAKLPGAQLRLVEVHEGDTIDMRWYIRGIFGEYLNGSRTWYAIENGRMVERRAIEFEMRLSSELEWDEIAPYLADSLYRQWQESQRSDLDDDA